MESLGNDPIEELLPTDDLVAEELTPDEQLAALSDAIDAEGTDPDDLIVATEEPPPLGRSWLFDFTKGRFVRGAMAGRRGPIETHGLATLQGWIEKCLHTERGSSPIHPDEYGLVGAYAGIGYPADHPVWADLEERIADALTFHPRISGIEDYEASSEPDDDFLAVRFTVVLDDDDAFPMEVTFPSG